MLQINQLSFAYQSDSPVIDHISTELPEGRIAGLLGANGVGKSTLLKLIAATLKPRTGRISASRHGLARRNVKWLQSLYYVPEKTWVPAMSSSRYAKLFAPLYPRFDWTLFNECLHRFELPHPKLLQDLSYGQQKKFLIAFGIAARTPLYLMDEPTNGLDIPAKEQFRQLLLETIGEEQSALISTHQAHDLQGLIDTVMLMDTHQLLTAGMDQLSDCFSVEQFAEKPDDALHGVKNFNQWLCLVPYRPGTKRDIDLQLLFSAFHQNQAAFKQQLTADIRQVGHTAQGHEGGSDVR